MEQVVATSSDLQQASGGRESSERARLEIAEIYALAGRIADARRVVADVSDPVRLAKAQAIIAEACARAGNTEDAQRIAADSEKAIAAIRDPLLLAETQAELARAYSKVGLQAAAERLRDQANKTLTAAERDAAKHDATDDSRRLDWTLGQVAQLHARNGQPSAAEQTAARINDLWSRDPALSSAAEAYARTGQFLEAEQVTLKIEDPGWTDRTSQEIASCYAATGRFDEAKRILAGIESRWSQTAALTAIASAYADAGQIEDAQRATTEAERIAGTLDSEQWRTKVAVALVEAFVEAGPDADMDKLTSGITRLPAAFTEAEPQCWAFIEIANVYTRAEQMADATRILDLAQRAADGIREPVSKSAALAGVINAYIGTGNIVEASQLTTLIELPEHRAHSMLDIALAYARVGKTAEAEQTATVIEVPELRDSAVREVVAAYARAGQPTEAERVAATLDAPREVESLANAAASTRVVNHNDPDSTTGPGNQDDPTPTGTADRLAVHAEKVAAAIVNDPPARVWAAVELSISYARSGQPAAALRIAKGAELETAKINEPWSVAWALTAVARAYANTESIQDVDRVIGRVRKVLDVGDTVALSAAMSGLSAACVQAGQPNVAELLAVHIDAANSQATALADIAQTYAQLGDASNAERIADDIARIDNPEAGDRYFAANRSWAESAKAYARAEQTGEADRVLEHVQDHWMRIEALEEIASLQANSGRLSDALQAAAMIGEPYVQARVLGRIALGWARRGDQPRAAQCVATAWSIADWWRCTTALGLVNSPALVRLAERELTEG
jgi:tetratricopeptide (TPR) repeat protein